MIRNELYKIFVNKTTVLFIIAVFFANIFQLIWMENRSMKYPASAYKAMWEDINKRADKEWDTILSEFDDKTGQLALACIGQEAEVDLYTDSPYKELALIERIRSEAETALKYKEYLENIDTAVKKYEMLNMFSKSEDSYAYRDLVKMQKAYAVWNEKSLFRRLLLEYGWQQNQT